jgi:FKBP-type peptidyl-prolyl cis-trans isomerase 2
MKIVEWGKFIKIQFTIMLEDGSFVGDAKEKTLLNFTLGDGKILSSLEKELVGMQVNETRKIQITPDDAYGEYDKSLVLRVERKNFPPDIELVVGRTVQYQNRDGERVNLMVNAADEKTVTIDGNHPLAGLKLIYEVELLECLDKAPPRAKKCKL